MQGRSLLELHSVGFCILRSHSVHYTERSMASARTWHSWCGHDACGLSRRSHAAYRSGYLGQCVLQDSSYRRERRTRVGGFYRQWVRREALAEVPGHFLSGHTTGKYALTDCVTGISIHLQRAAGEHTRPQPPKLSGDWRSTGSNLRSSVRSDL